MLAAKGADVNVRAARGQTALMWAASQKHPETVKVLLAHGADVKAKSAVWSEVMAILPHGYPEYNKTIPHGDETALMFAARVGDAESARLLVAAGADVNAADAWGVSATTLAAHSNFTDVVLLLLDKGADPGAARAGFSALHLAIMHRNEPMAAALLAHGADPNDPLKTWTPSRRSSSDFNFAPELVGATPFWLAARFGSPGTMRLLLEKGADPLFVHRGEYVAEGEKSEDGFPHRSHVTTPLMAAMGMGRGTAWVPVPAAQREAVALESAKIAAVPGVDLNLADTDGRTALDAARAARYTGVVSFLTERGEKSNGRLDVGWGRERGRDARVPVPIPDRECDEIRIHRRPARCRHRCRHRHIRQA
jgi:ankyrin repeat protein